MGLAKSIKKRLRRMRVRCMGRAHAGELKRLSSRHQGARWVVFVQNCAWNMVLYQRPQHIARELSKLGYLYLWYTDHSSDRVFGFKELHPGLVLTNRLDLLLDNAPVGSIIHFYSTAGQGITSEGIKRLQAKGLRVLYEYVDHIHEMVTMGPIHKSTRERHRFMLNSEEDWVVSTATRLHEEVALARRKNYSLVTNGVECSHFLRCRLPNAAVPKSMGRLLASQKPIVGYYGALAQWFDYELLEKLSCLRPDLELVLIGLDYDGSLWKTKLLQRPNVTFLGPVPYDTLPDTASWFDVALLPFGINEVTLSTSPIKVFEYMALGKPVVATDLPECRKYPCILLANDVEGFSRKIDEALAKRADAQYLRQLRDCALENDWSAKARAVHHLIAAQPTTLQSDLKT